MRTHRTIERGMKMRHDRRQLPIALAGLMGVILFVASSATSQESIPRAEDSSATITLPRSQAEWLLKEVDRLNTENEALRQVIAERDLEVNRMTRELDELRQFIADHREYGDDFDEYQRIRAIREREARQRQIDEARARQEAEQEARRARYEAAKERRAIDAAEDQRLEQYRRAGFNALGLDVYLGRSGFAYHTIDSETTRVDYDPFLGLYYRPGTPESRIDYMRMTISGSILNAADVTRNIGVAITFFDENGNQVGSEIVNIANARPNVPYPFTSTIDMALSRAFASSSSYVLYADEIEVPE